MTYLLINSWQRVVTLALLSRGVLALKVHWFQIALGVCGDLGSAGHDYLGKPQLIHRVLWTLEKLPAVSRLSMWKFPSETYSFTWPLKNSQQCPAWNLVYLLRRRND